MPVLTYFYSPVMEAAKIKYKNEYIVGKWFVRCSKNKGFTGALAFDSTFLEPGRRFLNLLDTDFEFGDYLYNCCKQVSQTADKLQTIYISDLTNNKISNLDLFYPDYKKVFSLAVGFGYSLDFAFDEYIKKNNINPSNLESVGLSFQNLEKNELRKIFLEKDQAEFDNKMREHILKYSWLLNNYAGEHLITKDYFLNRKSEVLNHSFVEDITKNSQPKNITEWISFLTYVRDERKRLNLIATGLLDRYLKNECSKLNISRDTAVLLTVEEFEKFKENISLIPERLERFIKITHEGLIDVSRKEWDEAFKEELITSSEIRGQIASKGTATGKVKIIINREDFDKLQNGEIIVASMTRPEFAPILNRCSAIITDEGGVTCHAAIVARELNIPCIIGTQIATEVLKDGDMVEVDADKGIVKVII